MSNTAGADGSAPEWGGCFDQCPKDLHWLPLAHHPPRQAQRCWRLKLGRRRLALCSRCSGLYPALALALALQAWLRPGSAGDLDWWLVLLASLPGLLDWGAGVLDPRSGSTGRRLLTGALLGLALGRSLWLYFGDPRSELFWTQALLLMAGALAFLFLRTLRPDKEKPL